MTAGILRGVLGFGFFDSGAISAIDFRGVEIRVEARALMGFVKGPAGMMRVASVAGAAGLLLQGQG